MKNKYVLRLRNVIINIVHSSTTIIYYIVESQILKYTLWCILGNCETFQIKQFCNVMLKFLLFSYISSIIIECLLDVQKYRSDFSGEKKAKTKVIKVFINLIKVDDA